jgi:hypothetical protein
LSARPLANFVRALVQISNHMLAVSCLARAVHARAKASANIAACVSHRVLRASRKARASSLALAFARLRLRASRKPAPHSRAPTASPRKSSPVRYCFVFFGVLALTGRSRGNQRATLAGSLRGCAAAAAPHLLSLGPCVSANGLRSRVLHTPCRCKHARRQTSWLTLRIACCVRRVECKHFLSCGRSRGFVGVHRQGLRRMRVCEQQRVSNLCCVLASRQRPARASVRGGKHRG